MIQTLSRMGWMYAAGAPNLLDQQDVRAASMRVLNWSIVPEAALALSNSLMRANNLIKHLIVNRDNMKRNFNASKNFIMSECVAMKLADKVGREQGYNMVKTLLKHADGSQTLQEIMLDSQDVLNVLSADEIIAACNPLSYLGCNDEMIDEVVTAFDSAKGRCETER